MSGRRTLEERIRIIKLYHKFENAHEVQRKWKEYFDTKPPHAKTILDLAHKFDITCSVEDASRDGRPVTVLTSEKLQQIENVVNENPFLSVRSGALQTEINRETYRLAQKTLEFKCHHPQFVTDLSDEDFDRRTEFCETMLEKFNSDRNFVDHILWTDEAEFKLNGTVYKHNCSYWAYENLHIQILVKNSKQGITIWCGITSSGLIGPFEFIENVTADSYLRMLKAEVWPKVRYKRLYFQQDGAPAHYGIDVRCWLDEKFKKKWIGRRGPIEWPARSPDLTVPDFFLWGYLRERVYRRSSSTIDELLNRIREACDEITPVMCQNACRSVPRRLADCLANGGKQL